MAFILNNLPIIICAVVGIILLMVEAFMPGFGLPGISGLALLLIAIILTWVEYGANAGLGATLIVIAIAGILLTISFKSAAGGRLSRSALVLKEPEGGAASPAGAELGRYVGKTGTAYTVLRPAGTADIDGERVNVVSFGEFIDKGAAIRVEAVEGTRVMVKRLG